MIGRCLGDVTEGEGSSKGNTAQATKAGRKPQARSLLSRKPFVEYHILLLLVMCYVDCEIGVFATYSSLKSGLLMSPSLVSDGLLALESELLQRSAAGKSQASLGEKTQTTAKGSWKAGMF